MSDAQTIDEILEAGRARAQPQPAVMIEDDDDTDRESMNETYGQVEGKVLSTAIHAHPLAHQIQFLYVELLALFFTVAGLQPTFVYMSADQVTAQIFILVFITMAWKICDYQWSNVCEEVLVLKVSTCGIKAARERESALSIAGVLLQAILLITLTSSVAFVRANDVVTWIFVCVIVFNAMLILLVAFFVEKCKRNLIMFA